MTAAGPRTVTEEIKLPGNSGSVKPETTVNMPADQAYTQRIQQVMNHAISAMAVTVSGKVADEKGDALPGVNVIEKGTSNGTSTDTNGEFRITVASTSSTLTFSFIGFVSQDIQVGNQQNFTVKLKSEDKSLEEVVVVGYGSQKKVNLTGAVSAIKIDDKITSRSLSNVSSGLSGLVPGLAVTQNSGMAGRNNAALIIRGLGTVNNSSPLVVVDGMPDVDINRINMNDIESISVLKDATSSSVYGSRAANGVILITTKSGKGQEKATINFSGNYAVQGSDQSVRFYGRLSARAYLTSTCSGG